MGGATPPNNSLNPTANSRAFMRKDFAGGGSRRRVISSVRHLGSETQLVKDERSAFGLVESLMVLTKKHEDGNAW